MTSLVSLKTLNYFNTSFMILNKLGSFYLVSLWHVLMFAARGLSRNWLVNIEIFLFLSLFVKLVVHVYNKKKIQMFLLNMSFI